ncbi:MAG: hypothetical protein KBH71_06160 [Anaerolineae bacterium]|nr:hypothetical protein [Anaerolineae bacterium]
MVNTRGGGDSPFLLQRTLDMAENLRHGILPARWMAHAAYDLGYPFFNHYAALPFYLSGGLTALGLSPLLAIQATQTLGFLLAALTLALWAQRVYGNRRATLLAVAAYAFAPFHLVNVYVRGDSLSEFWAFVWYPLILWTLDRAAERPTLRRVTLAALSYAALILTHNVSALIFAPFALLYAINQQIGKSANQQISESANLQENESTSQRISENTNHALRITHYIVRSTQYAVRLISPFLLAFLLTAWFWIPAIGETGYGQMGPEFTAGYFHYSNHFRGLNLVQRTFLFDYSVAGDAAAAGPFAMGGVQAALALLGAGALIWQIGEKARKREGEKAKKREGEKARKREGGKASHILRSTQHAFILFSLALSTFMITPLSAPLWEHLPLLATTQFPWRFLSVQALFTAMATAALAHQREGEKAEKREGEKAERRESDSRFTQYAVRITNYAVRITQHAVPALLIVCLALAALGALRPERLLITADDVTWDNLLLYEAFTGNIGTTIRYEYLPRDVKPRLYLSEAVVDGVDAAQPIADGGVTVTAALLDRRPDRQTWQLTVAGDAPVTFPLTWWPGWQAEVDGVAAEAYPMTGSGRLTVDLAAGEHTVTLQLRATPLRAAAEWISALTVVGLCAAFFQRSGAAARRRRELAGFLKAVGALLSVFALAVILPALFALSSSLPLSPATFDFIQMPLATRGPVYFGTPWHARLGTGDAVLTAVGALPEGVAPAQTLAVPLTWELPTPKLITATLRLVSPAEPRHGVPYGLAETTFTLAGQVTPTLELPADLSRGLYLLELRVFGIEGELPARTATGAERGALYLGAVRVTQGPSLPADAPVLARFRDLTLHAVEAQQPDPTTLRLKLHWSLAQRAPRNWSLSLRLLDADGRQLSQVDLQPGYGYLPTTLWQAGELVTDYPTLSLPEGLAPGDYTLHVISYLEATMETGGEVELPIRLTGVTVRDPRERCCEWQYREEQTLCAAGGVTLIGLALPEAHPEGAALEFTAEWYAAALPSADLTARWEALDAAGNGVATREGPLAPGSRTSAWPRFAWVRAPVTLALPPLLPDGPYTLRLTLLAEGAISQTCELGVLNIAPRPRSFTLPAPTYPQQAAFGDEIRLLGYDLSRDADTLRVTLWWQAQTVPARDYKRFVHVLAASGEILAQDDAMPRAWTYPTSWWAAGEVVSETVTLPAPPGDYRLGVGWYDGDTGVTLPAAAADGTPWADNRVLLNAK